MWANNLNVIDFSRMTNIQKEKLLDEILERQKALVRFLNPELEEAYVEKLQKIKNSQEEIFLKWAGLKTKNEIC